MNMLKVNGQWQTELQATCPACRMTIRKLRPEKPKRFPSGTRCPGCGYRVDKVYFD